MILKLRYQIASFLLYRVSVAQTQTIKLHQGGLAAMALLPLGQIILHCGRLSHALKCVQQYSCCYISNTPSNQLHLPKCLQKLSSVPWGNPLPENTDKVFHDLLSVDLSAVLMRHLERNWQWLQRILVSRALVLVVLNHAFHCSSSLFCLFSFVCDFLK